jgi:hypothetical protein
VTDAQASDAPLFVRELAFARPEAASSLVGADLLGVRVKCRRRRAAEPVPGEVTQLVQVARFAVPAVADTWVSRAADPLCAARR